MRPVNDQAVRAIGTSDAWLRTTDGGTTWEHRAAPGGGARQFRDVQGVAATTTWLPSAGTADHGRNWSVAPASAHATRAVGARDRIGTFSGS